MNNLINIKNEDGKPVVSSREVAEHFEKRHDNVLRDIDDLISDSSKLRDEFFITSEYGTDRGKTYREYLLTKNGFALLAMGFTGKKALEWKLKYIEAFDKMERALSQVYHISETALVNNIMDNLEGKLFTHIDRRFEAVAENFRPSHANKIDLCRYIRGGLGDEREDGEVDLVKQRVLFMLNAEAWQDIPYEKFIGHMDIVDESIRSVKSFRTKKQVSLFDN